MNQKNPDHNRLTIADLAALLALLGLVIAFFWKMALTDQILPRGDAFTYFYPYWAYRNAALRAGRIPHWNPYLFMGAPFLANSQAGVLYPPNWLLIGLDAPTAVKVAILTHLTWAAAGAYLFARRSLKLSVLAATLGATTFALGGYLTSQVEHVNQLQGLAWLPWLFLLWTAFQRGHPKALYALGLAFAMQLLAGHTQSAFISGAALGIWALWHTLRPQPTTDNTPEPPTAALKQHIRPLATVALAVILALGLAAPQILPTLELARLSYRSGGLPFLEAVSFSFKPHILGRALLPSYAPEPLFSEYVAFIGLVGIMLALWGAWLKRREWPMLGLAVLSILGLFLALGAYNPLYWILVRYVPGFDLFRAPARWLALWAFGTAMLAGVGFDSLSQSPRQSTAPRLADLWPAAIVIILAALSFLAPTSRDPVPGATPPAPPELAIWLATLLLSLAAMIWLRREDSLSRRFAPSTLAALLVVELFLGTRNLPYNDLGPPTAWTDQRPAISTLLAAADDTPFPGRFLSISDILFDPGDKREIEAVYGPYLSDDALFDFLVAAKQKEILAPNLSMAWGIPAMDGFDGGLLPTRDYMAFTALFLEPDAVAPDGRLRENLTAVPDLAWLHLSNVRWIITDKVSDAWIDGVYYDLQFPTQAVPPNTPPAVALPLLPFEATTIGIIGYVENAQNIPDGTQIGTIAVYYDGAQQPLVQPLLQGRDLTTDPSDTTTATFVRWPTPRRIERVEITTLEDTPASPVIRGLTLLDDRTGAFMPTTISRGGAVRLIHSAEVKIYEIADTPPYVTIVCDPPLVHTADEARQVLAQHAGQTTILEEHPRGAWLEQFVPPTDAKCDPDSPGEVRLISYDPERIVVQVKSRGMDNYLLLSEAWYPGWSARTGDRGLYTRLYRANGLFRAVRLLPGDYEVTIRYENYPFRAGMTIATATLVVVIAGLALHWSPRDDPPPP